MCLYVTLLLNKVIEPKDGPSINLKIGKPADLLIHITPYVTILKMAMGTYPMGTTNPYSYPHPLGEILPVRLPVFGYGWKIHPYLYPHG